MALDVEKLLKELEGSGVDVAALREHTGGFTKSLESFVEEVGQERASEAAQEVQGWKEKFEEADKDSRSKDAAMSKMDRELKDAQVKLAAAQVSTGDTDTAVTAAMEAMKGEVTGQIQELMTKLEAQDVENKRLAAEVAWNQTVDELAKEFPVLNERKFKELIPQTSDKAVLRERAQLLTDFRSATQDEAYQQFRDGHVPATSPPLVKSGDAEGAQKEVARVNSLLDTGEITPQEAQTKLAAIARMVKPEP